jgi:hypothetical protein
VHYLTSTGSAAKCRPSGVKSLFSSTAPTFLSRSNAESTFSSAGGSSVPAAGDKSMLILLNHLISPLCTSITDEMFMSRHCFEFIVKTEIIVHFHI